MSGQSIYQKQFQLCKRRIEREFGALNLLADENRSHFGIFIPQTHLHGNQFSAVLAQKALQITLS